VRTRLLAALAVVAGVLALPGSAVAGQFAVGWGSGPMNGNGWATRLDGTSGAQCGFEDIGTVFLGAGTLASHTGCFELFNAPAQSSILGVEVWFTLAKASAAPALCARSFTGGFSRVPLNQCASVSDAHASIPVDGSAGAKWVELGLYNDGSTPVTLTTARANNIRFERGWVLLDDPTGPAAVSLAGIGHVVTGDAEAVAWSATDPESSIGRVTATIDGTLTVPVVGDGCVSVFQCGATRSGTVSLTGLSGLADGWHRLDLQASSAGGVATTAVTFRSDHGAPGPPGLSLAPDPFSLGPWRGRLGLLTVAGTAPDAVATGVRLLDGAGAGAWSTSIGAPVGTTVLPDPAEAGPFAIDAWQCDDVGHCGGAARLEGLFDPATPADAATADEPGWVGAAAAAEGTRLAWPPLSGPAPASGVAAGFVGLGPGRAEAQAAAVTGARAWSPPSGPPEAGRPGETLAAVPAALVHGAARVCVAVIPVSSAGHLASLAPERVGTRCIRVDEEPPTMALEAPAGWSGGRATLTAISADAGSGVADVEATLDGAPAAVVAGHVAVAAEGDHLVHVRVTDRAGNDREATAHVRVDETAPSLVGAPRVSFAGRTLSVQLRDVASGVGPVAITVGDRRLDAAVVPDSPDAVVATVHVPGGEPLDGLPVTVEAHDLARPANVLSRTAPSVPSRATPELRVLRRGSCRPTPGCAVVRGQVTDNAGRPLAGVGVTLTAAPRGRPVQTAGPAVTDTHGLLAVRVRPARTTRYELAVTGDEHVRPSARVTAGTVSVAARITGFRLEAHGGRLRVRARYTGRGETAWVRLEAGAPAGGPWVDACLVGRRAVRLDRRGRIRGGCAIPAAAMGLRFRFRLVLAARDTTWPWLDRPGPVVVIRLPRR
jgi:hypothetical protein